MKGREAKGAPPADLLVCFPSRAHLALIPKPICSPARPSEPNKRHHHHHLQQLKKSAARGGAQASPLMWAKTKSMGKEISEPTSPKVTCAGQIKVRHKGSSCKSWQSVMEEIEKMHNSRKYKKRASWVDALGFKKEIMQFLSCLRGMRLDFRCFGAFPSSDVTTEDEDEEEDEECQEHHADAEPSCGNRRRHPSGTMFSQWFMVLQENQNSGFFDEAKEKKNTFTSCDDGSAQPPAVPPPNALLLMRCRSAPAKTWLDQNQHKEEEDDDEEEEEEEEDEENEDDDNDAPKEKTKVNQLKTLIEEEKRKDGENKRKKQSLMSSDIANETWVLAGTRDPLSRSRSWKR